MEQGQRRTGDSVLFRTGKIVISLSLLMAASAGNLFAQRDAGLMGVVRDTRGRPQMGVTVELFGPVAATALTDLQGHYQIKDVLPGVYQLRASATLYLPSLQRQLRLAAGRRSVVNLTMTGLFDEAAWMSSSHRDAADGSDDWKWTLRSPANRPLLRLAAEDTLSGVSRREGSGQRGETHTALSVTQGQGGFGNAGACVQFSVSQHTADQKRMLGVRSSSCKAAGDSTGSSLSLATTFETGDSFSGMRRISSRVRTFPQIRDASGSPLTEVEFASAERMQIGDLLALEAGSDIQLLSVGRSIVVSHPFLRVTARPGLGWTTSYSFATATGMSQYDDLGFQDRPTPTVIATGTGLLSESGLHHEIAARHSVGRGKIEVAYHHDSTRRSVISGVLAKQSEGAALRESQATASAISLDSSNGTFRTFAPGYAAGGGGVVVDYPIGEDLDVSGGYLTSTAMKLLSTSAKSDNDRFAAARSQAFLVAVSAGMKRSGTRVVTSYRWQPASTITVLAPYDAGSTSPYLSVHLHQTLPKSRMLPPGAEITVDGDNLLREGYQSDIIAKQQALLASALQELRAGLTFTF